MTKLKLPALGQGTWMIEDAPRDRAIEALRCGIDLGLTLIDTAEMYGNGVAEEIVAEAIAGRRDRIFLVSKVLPSNASYDGTLQACERSLRRLRTDVLDLYLLHWASSHPIRETMRAMETLIDRGQVRHTGVSNFDVEQVQEAQQALKNVPLAGNQVLYHLRDRGIERRLIPYCRQQGIEVMGYSPFGHRDFPKPKTAGGRILEEIGVRRKKTARQVALSFLTSHGICAIPKAATVEHASENAASVGWSLTPEEFGILDRAFPVPDHDVPLGML